MMDKLSSLIQKLNLIKNLLDPSESRDFTKEEIEGVIDQIWVVGRNKNS